MERPKRPPTPEQEERDQELRLKKVIAMLDAEPGKERAIATESSTEHVYVTVAIRGLAAFEMTIPHAKYDGFNLIDLIDRHCGTVPE